MKSIEKIIVSHCYSVTLVYFYTAIPIGIQCTVFII